MITNKPYETSNLADKAARSADDAIKSTQKVANSALDGLSSTVQDVRDDAAPLLNRVGEQASALAQRSKEAVLDTSAQIRDRALRAGDTTVSYIKDEPVKAMLIAAATGAALMALIGLMGRHRDRGY